ncbi:hypothetical protein LY76DRAFT_529452, partial [Colletotrichum caudatum]
LCCDLGTLDDSKICTNQGLDSFCLDNALAQHGCDNWERFPIVRSVLSFVASGSCRRLLSSGDEMLEFIGCV